jgi:hypothetical protein
MRSATAKALALFAVLTVAVPTVVTAGAEDGSSSAIPPAVHSTGDTADPGMPSNTALSTLGALGLGVLGLFLVRRHTGL